MATIKDVANMAGVSVATVSRVLNSPESVKYETRNKVAGAIDALHYSPNFLGRNLRRLETRRILVLLDSISNQVFSRVLRGIEEKAKANDFTVTICTVRANKDTFMEHMKMLQTKVVDGAIVLCSDLAEKEISSLSAHYPIVCACEPITDSKITSVCVDDFAAGYDATNFLIERGHKEIAVLGMPDMKANSYSSGRRMRGYMKAMMEHGLRVSEEFLLDDGYTYNSGRRAVRRLLDMGSLPDAIFSFSDAGAIGAVKEFFANGISVPDDVSVMGFDNTAISEIYIPSITTVSQPQYDIGAKAMELLIDKISGKPCEKNVRLPHEIIVRDSVKKV